MYHVWRKEGGEGGGEGGREGGEGRERGGIGGGREVCSFLFVLCFIACWKLKVRDCSFCGVFLKAALFTQRLLSVCFPQVSKQHTTSI